MPLVTPLLATATLVGAAFDVRTRRIPNALALALVAAALAVHASEGPAAVASDLLAGVVAFLAGTVAFARGWLGGGDVKLISASCVLVGAAGSSWFVLDVLVAGGVLAIADAARRRRLRALVASALMTTAGGLPTEARALPYGVAIAAGACAYAVVPYLRFAP